VEGSLSQIFTSIISTISTFPSFESAILRFSVWRENTPITGLQISISPLHRQPSPTLMAQSV
jgi:hypothetical protein